MQLTVEFLGQARRLAQTKEVTVTLDGPASFRDVVRWVAERYPALVGPVIVPHSYDLLPSYMLNMDGRRAVGDLDAAAADGQRLVLMFVEAGG